MTQSNPLKCAKKGNPLDIACLQVLIQLSTALLIKVKTFFFIYIDPLKVTLKRLSFLGILLFYFCLCFPNPAQAELTTINVEIDPAKANSKKWDILNGGPDIAICVTNQVVGMMCFPDGDKVELITTSQCPNSFKCKFSADVPEGNFKISVVDVDVALNDPIGTGLCHTGMTCEIGQAKVTIGDPQY